MRPTALFTLLLLSFSISYGQTEKIKADRFSSIRIFGPFKVTLVKAEASRAEIDYHGLDAENVIVKCEGNELNIRLRNRTFFDFSDDNRHSKGYAKVTVYYTSLENIEAKAGASIRSNEPLTGKNINLVSKMGAEMNLAIKAERVELDASMGSQVELAGTAEEVEIRSKMGSTVNASHLQSKNVVVSSSMGSEVFVFAENELDASADFGATVSYQGNPSHKHTNTFLGAEVKSKKNH